MIRLQDWPALSEFGSTSGAVRYVRAVRGKVHRAATDYRWVAASQGFDPGAGGLLGLASLGAEDSPAVCSCWRSFGRGFVAINAYPSRARDAAGRPGGVEKQFVVVADPAMPAAALAFVLLEKAATFDDTVWWDSWTDNRWPDLTFRLTIEDSQSEPVAWTAAGLATQVETGRRELVTVTSREALASFYQGMLDGAAPAVLAAPTALSPLALAALLLPLPRDQAAVASIAGWLPSRQLIREQLTHWSGVVFSGEPVGVRYSSAASEMAEAIWSGAPPEHRMSRVGPAAVEQVAPQPVVPQMEAVREPLSPRGPDAFLREFLSSDARRFDPAKLDLTNCPILEIATSASLLAHVSQYDRSVEQDRLYFADPHRQEARKMHLRVKGDLARALLYVLMPDSELLSELPPRLAALVPALWFAPLLERGQWNRLDRYKPADLGILVGHSADPRRLRAPLDEWLVKWAETLDEERRLMVVRGLGDESGEA